MTDNPNQNQQTPKGLKGPGKKNLPKYRRSPFGWLVIFLIIISAMMMLRGIRRPETISYIPDFMDYIDKGYIESLDFQKSRGRNSPTTT